MRWKGNASWDEHLLVLSWSGWIDMNLRALEDSCSTMSYIIQDLTPSWGVGCSPDLCCWGGCGLIEWLSSQVWRAVLLLLYAMDPHQSFITHNINALSQPLLLSLKWNLHRNPLNQSLSPPFYSKEVSIQRLKTKQLIVDEQKHGTSLAQELY